MRGAHQAGPFWGSKGEASHHPCALASSQVASVWCTRRQEHSGMRLVQTHQGAGCGFCLRRVMSSQTSLRTPS